MIVCLLFVFVYFVLLFFKLNERLAIEKADSDVF